MDNDSDMTEVKECELVRQAKAESLITEIEERSRQLREIAPFYRDKCFVVGPDCRLAWVDAYEVDDRREHIRVLGLVIDAEQKYLASIQARVKATEKRIKELSSGVSQVLIN